MPNSALPRRWRRIAHVSLALTAASQGSPADRTALAQSPPLPIEDLPLAQYGAPRAGGTVTPVYEGWYANPDGTFTVYFGYYNRNTDEAVDIPVGADNRIDGVGEGFDHGQPSRFEPGRHWGVFGVDVPRDFGHGRVTWHLAVRGKSFDIAGSLKEPWSVPAISGDAMGNHPPRVWLERGGAAGYGPGGVWTGPRQATVNTPVSLAVTADDDGTETSGRPRARTDPVTLSWSVYRGPGAVTFNPERGTVPDAGGEMVTRVTFSEPGRYVLRVEANDDSGFASAGYEQCCWTNGFVEFIVGR